MRIYVCSVRVEYRGGGARCRNEVSFYVGTPQFHENRARFARAILGEHDSAVYKGTHGRVFGVGAVDPAGQFEFLVQYPDRPTPVRFKVLGWEYKDYAGGAMEC